MLTERQKKWFATVQANFETATGKPRAAWVEIMKTCPETALQAQAARLTPAVRKESWSERPSAVVELDDAAAVDDEIARLFAAAAENG